MKIQYVLFSILSLSFAASTFAASFYGDDKYEIVETPMTWSEADAYAKSKGAILVKIETAEQNTWLKNFLKSVDTTAADGGGAIYSWLGGTDSVAEGTWLWGDGTQVPLNDSGSIWWGNGSGHGAGGSEPDNFNGTQHCLAIGLSGWPSGAPGFYGTAGQWNDINCTNKLTFAIQYPSAKISQIERDALVALYNSTDGANWKDNTGWMGEVGTECLWYGVTCSSASVTRLSLANNSLTGTIPSELGNLADLSYLYLGANSLNGNIPKELGNLTNLSYLHIGNNSLSGSIPKELGNLTKLTGIYLFSNDLTGAIPQEWIDITNVNYNGNLLVGPGLSISSVERDALVALYNSTDGANWKDNTGWMGEVGTECRWLGVTCSSASVTQLSLMSNSLTGTIPSELGNLTNLTWLNLSRNSLSGGIPGELGNLTNLEQLNLSDNSLSGSIPRELGSLTNLEELNLYGNSLSGNIPAELGNLSNLKYLWLAVNSLTGSIPSELGNLALLSVLTLSNNDLTGAVPASLNAFNIKNSAFKYEPTDEWPAPYNGVTPNPSLGLAFNNIGFFRAADATIYVCLRVFTDGLASSVNGVGKFDIGMKVFSLANATIQITKSREFNTGFYFNEKADLPDCSGKFETTTGVYSDIIQTDTSVLETTWSLVDPVNLILKLESSKDLTAE